MGELRRIKFSLAIPGQSIMDYDADNPEDKADKMKERYGFFHCFGNHLSWDAENSQYLNRVVGIVEEESTGKVYEVYPETITFIK